VSNKWEAAGGWKAWKESGAPVEGMNDGGFHSTQDKKGTGMATASAPERKGFRPAAPPGVECL